ncbi:MAG TPA: hypothetical protein VF476_04190 [Chitinophagaceae bacterium]
MTTDSLHKKISRYLQRRSMPAETRQIQTWLSVTEKNIQPSVEEMAIIEKEILTEVQAYTAYPLFHPKPAPWWRKFTAFF